MSKDATMPWLEALRPSPQYVLARGILRPIRFIKIISGFQTLTRRLLSIVLYAVVFP